MSGEDFGTYAFAASTRRLIPKHPEGWEPGVAWDGRKGQITTESSSTVEPDWGIVLERANLDPATIEVVPGSVQVRTWDAAIGNGEVRTFRYFKAEVRAKRANTPDVDELLRLIRKRAAILPAMAVAGEAFVVGLSDWQLGKRGTAQTVERIRTALAKAAKRLAALRKRDGRNITTVVLACLGDMGESCDGHYPMQAFQTELDYREQRRLGSQLILLAIDTFVVSGLRVIVVVVGGNHGESRRDGKAYTNFGDNQDIEMVENVALACRMHPDRYGNVSFVIPDQELTLTLEVGGLITGFAHGHQARRGANAQQRVANWWSGQAMGQRPVGDARILYTGHYHSLSIVEHGPRIHVQCPTMDSGSQWWDETAGLPSRAGMLTVVQGPDGLHDWEVL